MTDDERRLILDTMNEFHVRELRNVADHLLRNFRGEVDVISGKLDRLRERVDVLEGKKGEP